MAIIGVFKTENKVDSYVMTTDNGGVEQVMIVDKAALTEQVQKENI